MSCLSN